MLCMCTLFNHQSVTVFIPKLVQMAVYNCLPAVFSAGKSVQYEQHNDTY